MPFLLEAFLEDDDPVVLGSSAGAMATIGPDAMETLLGILKNPDCTPFQVGLINLALSFIGAKAPETLLSAADSDSAEVRVAAISALGDQIQSLGDTKAQRKVFEALEDISPDVRAEAVTLIGKSCDAEDVEELLTKMLIDEDLQVRKNTAMALMKLGAINKIEAIREAKSIESNESVAGVFGVAINILSRDAQEESE